MAGVIAYRNDSDKGTITATSSLTGYPVGNLKSRQLSSVWRGNIGSNLSIDLGKVLPIALVALLGTNRLAPDPTDGDMIVTASLDGISYFPYAIGTSANDNGIIGLPRNVFGASGSASPVTARYLKVFPKWSTQAGVSYLEVARLWIGDSIILPHGCDANWSLGFDDPGTLDVSKGRQTYEAVQLKTRTLRCDLTTQETSVMFGYNEADTFASDNPCIQGLQMEAGCTGEVIVLPRTSTALWIRRLGIYGHIDPGSRPEISHTAGAYYSTSFTAIEER